MKRWVFGLVLASAPAWAEPEFRSMLTIPGDATDLMPTKAAGANTNRLGGFFSDLHYDRATDSYLALPDRGPGGGTIAYDTRLQRYKLDVDPATGAISNLRLTATVPLTTGGLAFDGLNPGRMGNKAVLGRSLDPEGVMAGRDGRFYVADEYGPSVLEFAPDGMLLRTFTPPTNLQPRQPDGTLNYVDGRPAIATGRQDNRGYEGLAMLPDGSKLYAVLQGPLVQEGAPDGRHSQNVRIVEYDIATGRAGRQLMYPLDAVSDLNALVAGAPFNDTAQGRSIGVSAIVALNATEFLVLERDNRGQGVDDPVAKAPVASKRIYRVDMTDATDVSAMVFGANTLPAGVVPVGKALFLDVAVALRAAGLTIPEKIEGLTVGPRLSDGSYALLVGTDNDFSVTQNGTGTQLNVCTDGKAAEQVALDAPCPVGLALLPTALYSFKADIPGYVAPGGP